jgi:hypothetical protein
METLDREKVAGNLNNAFTIKWVHLGVVIIQGAIKAAKCQILSLKIKDLFIYFHLKPW